MEICQFCGMYMKPFISKAKKEASCEFCGEIIAKVVNNKWKKVKVKP